jgi:hypothetical protein
MNISIVLFLILVSFLNFTNIKNSFSQNSPRPISSERPSKSDNPLTLNQYQIQLESSLFSNVFDKNKSQKIIRRNLFDFSMLRFGISDSFEFQLIDNFLFSSLKNHQQKIKDNQINSGDKFIRLKYNILGNDSQKFGLAITTFNKIHTADNQLAKEQLQSGIVAPFSYNISNDYSLGGMLQINYYRDNKIIGKNHFFGIINSYYLARNFSDKFSSYIEFYSLTINNKKNIVKNYLDFGTNYIINQNLKIDAGINFGINDSADNLQIFSGFTARF